MNLHNDAVLAYIIVKFMSRNEGDNVSCIVLLTVQIRCKLNHC